MPEPFETTIWSTYDVTTEEGISGNDVTMENAAEATAISNVTYESALNPNVRLANTIIYMSAESLICVAIIIGNSLVLRAIQTERRLQTFTNYFVANLALADLLVGVVGIPLSLVAFLGHPRGFFGCLFVNTLIIMLTQVSIFGLVMISLERFVAIRYPFVYEENSRRRTALVALIICWILAFLVGMVPIMGWNLRSSYDGKSCNFIAVVSMQYMVYFNFFGFVLVPLLLMLGVYCYMFKIVRQQMQMIAKQEISLKPSPQHSPNDSGGHQQSDDSDTENHTSMPYIPTYTLAESLSTEHPDLYHERGSSRTQIYSISTPYLSQKPRTTVEPSVCQLKSIKRTLSPVEVLCLHSTDVRLVPYFLQGVVCNGSPLSPRPAKTNSNSNGSLASEQGAYSSRSPSRTLENSQQHHRSHNRRTRRAMRAFLAAFRRDLRAAKWFAIVIAVFALCWLPLHILNTISLLAGPTPPPLVSIAIVMSHANSAINPILYAYSNTKFKTVMLRLLCCGRGKYAKDSKSSIYKASDRRMRQRNQTNNGTNTHVQNSV